MTEATYITRPSVDGHGTFYYTTCCRNRIYSVRDKYAYDGCLCPWCAWVFNKKVVLRLADAERDFESQAESEQQESEDKDDKT